MPGENQGSDHSRRSVLSKFAKAGAGAVGLAAAGSGTAAAHSGNHWLYHPDGDPIPYYEPEGYVNCSWGWGYNFDHKGWWNHGPYCVNLVDSAKDCYSTYYDVDGSYWAHEYYIGGDC